MPILLILLVNPAWAENPDEDPFLDINTWVNNATPSENNSCFAYPRGNASVCDFKGPRGDLKLVPKDWGLTMTGADLMRDDPVVKNLSYGTSLGIVDSGLRLRGNPKAGEKLAQGSPEIDGGVFHGTHVAGIATSQSHGVNPYLPLKAFPVKLNPFGGAKSEDLMNSLDQAINDPSVKVINLSWSFYENPQLVDLVDQGIKKGKWFVYAAGNEDTVSNIGTTGHDHFLNRSSFFKTGASSYFGSPAAFSNTGPDVTVYAPGSHIDSLDGRHNSNLIAARSSVPMDGTSMASPHFAAVLATLANLQPQLDSETIKYLVQSTAMNTGTHARPFLFLNAYLAFKTLQGANACLKTKTLARTCIDQSRKKQLQSAVLPKKPVPSTCSALKDYYSSLRKAYFLSQGGSLAKNALKELFASEVKPIAEKFMFLGNDHSERKKLLSKKTLPGIYSREANRAMDFSDGKLDFDQVNRKFDSTQHRPYTLEDWLANKPRATDKHPLELLLPTPENFEKFLDFCKSQFYSTDNKAPCLTFVGGAPRRFKEKLLSHLSSLDPPLKNIDMLDSLNFQYDPAFNDAYQQVFNKTVQYCIEKIKCDLRGLENLYKSKFITLEGKQKLSHLMLERLKSGEKIPDYFRPDQFERADIQESYIKLWKIRSDLSQEESKSEIKKHAFELKEALMQSTHEGKNSVLERGIYEKGGETAHAKESKAATLLRYLSLLAEAGQRPPELMNAIEDAVDKYSDINDYFTEAAPLKNALNRIIRSDSAPDLAAYLAKTDRLLQVLRVPGLDLDLLDLLRNENVAEDTKRKLLKAVISMPEGYMMSKLSAILSYGTDIPAVQEVQREVDRSDKKNKLYPLKENQLWSSTRLDHVTPDFQLILEKRRSDPPFWILGSNPKLCVVSPEARQLTHAALREISEGKMEDDQGLRAWNWIDSMEPASIREFGSEVVNALQKMPSRNVVPVRTLQSLVKNIVVHQGENTELVKKMIETLKPFVHDESFLWRTESGKTKDGYEKLAAAGYRPARGAEYLLNYFTLLNASVAGNQILKNDPIWADLQKINANTSLQGIPSTAELFDQRENITPIPPALKDFYLKKFEIHLESITEKHSLQGADLKFDSEMIHYPELIGPIIQHLQTESDDTATYQYLIQKLVNFGHQSPQNAKLLLDQLKDQDFTFKVSLLFDDRKKTFSLKEIIGKYLDYEK